MTEISATIKKLRMSAKKIRPVAENLKGKKAEAVLVSLRFVSKKAANPLSKVLKSAMANATKNFSLPSEKLIVKEVRVDEGPTLKRFRPVSRGSAHSILKRSSQIKIILVEGS